MEHISEQQDENAIIDRNQQIQNEESPDISLYCESVGLVRMKPKFPNFTSKTSRCDSYTNWPEFHHLRPNELSEAGFIFKGVSDNVQCFHCGGGLRHWAVEDDVWVEHAIWFPKCAFLLKEKGSDFVATVQEMSKDMDEIPYDDVIQRMQEFVPPSPLKAIEEFCKLSEQQQLNTKCRLCSLRDPGVMFLPCSHFVCCTECSDSLTSCPLCHTRIDKTVKAHVSPVHPGA